MTVLMPASLLVFSLFGYPSASAHHRLCFLVSSILLSTLFHSKRSVLKDGINMLNTLRYTGTTVSLLFGSFYTCLVLYLVIPVNAVHILVWIWTTESALNFLSTIISRETFTWYHHAESSKLSFWHRFSLSIFSGVFLTLFIPLRLSLVLAKARSSHPWFAFLTRYFEPASSYSLVFASINDKPCLHAGHSIGRLFRHNLLSNSLTCYFIDLILLLPLLLIFTINHPNLLTTYSIWSITRFYSSNVKNLLDSCYVCFAIDCDNERAPLRTMMHRVFTCKQLRSDGNSRRDRSIRSIGV
jgi:hypothetical protein